MGSRHQVPQTPESLSTQGQLGLRRNVPGQWWPAASPHQPPRSPGAWRPDPGASASVPGMPPSSRVPTRGVGCSELPMASSSLSPSTRASPQTPSRGVGRNAQSVTAGGGHTGPLEAQVRVWDAACWLQGITDGHRVPCPHPAEAP